MKQSTVTDLYASSRSGALCNCKFFSPYRGSAHVVLVGRTHQQTTFAHHIYAYAGRYFTRAKRTCARPDRDGMIINAYAYVRTRIGYLYTAFRIQRARAPSRRVRRAIRSPNPIPAETSPRSSVPTREVRYDLYNLIASRPVVLLRTRVHGVGDGPRYRNKRIGHGYACIARTRRAGRENVTRDRRRDTQGRIWGAADYAAAWDGTFWRAAKSRWIFILFLYS